MVYLRDLNPCMRDEFICRLQNSGTKSAKVILQAVANEQDVQIGEYFPDDKFKIVV